MPAPLRSFALPIVLLAALVLPAGAAAQTPPQGSFLPGQPVDGPSPDILALGGIDISRDGTGVLTWVKNDGGVPHVFASRLEKGTFRPPERLDGGLPSAASQPVAAASDGERLVVAFVAGGTLFATVRPAGATAWLPPQPLADGASNPSADMSINGTAYITFTQNGDVRAATMFRKDTAFTVLPAPLDVNQPDTAGIGTLRSQVVVSADGSALVMFGEQEADGRSHVIGRRVFGQSISQAPQDLTLDQFGGHAGGSADLPSADIEDDSSFAWAVFRQTFADGAGGTTTRILARRLLGSEFEPPVEIDGQAFPGEAVGAPSIAMTSKGDGLAAVGGAASNGVFGAILKDNIFNPGQRLDAGNAVPPSPVAATGDNGLGLIAWVQGTSFADASVHARSIYDDRAVRTVPLPGPEATLSDPALGPVDTTTPPEAASDRVGDTAIAFLQGTPDQRRIVVSVFARNPGAFSPTTSSKWRRSKRPTLSWAPAGGLWGISYTVTIDGQPFGTTTDTSLRPVKDVPDGVHRWQVIATTSRGTKTTSRTATLRVDATAPRATFRVARSGAVARVTAKVSDSEGPAVRVSGVALVKIDWGDGTVPTLARKGTHQYRRAGAYTIRVIATDTAGNVRTVRRRIQVH
jgi:PKD domain